MLPELPRQRFLCLVVAVLWVCWPYVWLNPSVYLSLFLLPLGMIWVIKSCCCWLKMKSIRCCPYLDCCHCRNILTFHLLHLFFINFASLDSKLTSTPIFSCTRWNILPFHLLHLFYINFASLDSKLTSNPIFSCSRWNDYFEWSVLSRPLDMGFDASTKQCEWLAEKNRCNSWPLIRPIYIFSKHSESIFFY